MLTDNEIVRLKIFLLQAEMLGQENIPREEKEWVLEITRREQLPIDKATLDEIEAEGLDITGIVVTPCIN
jgi:hypothetical protein